MDPISMIERTTTHQVYNPYHDLYRKPERHGKRAAKKSVMLHHKSGRTVDPSKTGMKQMRRISGLGMEDPVYGKFEGAQQSHPSIFDDMSLGDIEESMRDMISVASDPTAEIDKGIDSNVFHSSLCDMHFSMSDFSTTELFNASGESFTDLDVAMERLGQSKSKFKKGLHHTKRTYVSTKVDPLGLPRRIREKPTTSKVEVDETTTETETVPSTRSGASVVSLTIQDLAGRPLASQHSGGTSKSLLSSPYDNSIDVDSDRCSLASTAFAPSVASLRKEPYCHTGREAECPPPKTSWEEQVKLISQKYDLTRRQSRTSIHESRHGSNPGSDHTRSSSLMGTLNPPKSPTKKLCHNLGLSPRKKVDSSSPMNSQNAWLNAVLVATRSIPEVSMDHDDSHNGGEKQVSLTETSVGTSARSTESFAENCHKIFRAPFTIPFPTTQNMASRLLPTIAAIFPDEFQTSWNQSTLSQVLANGATPETRASDDVSYAQSIGVPQPVSVRSFYGDNSNNEEDEEEEGADSEGDEHETFRNQTNNKIENTRILNNRRQSIGDATYFGSTHAVRSIETTAKA